MALTQITDIINPSVFLKYQKDYTPQSFDLLASSALTGVPPEVEAQMAAGGTIIDMPFWNDIARGEPQIINDDPTSIGVPKNITATKEQARKLYLAEAWSQADLAGMIATGSGKDPLAQISDNISLYWRNAAMQAVIKVLDGIRADNAANDNSDMRYSVYSDIATPLAANKISPAALTRARLTAGEFLNQMGTIVMHSKVYGDALDQEAITFVQPSNLPFQIAKFAGMDVVVSDSCTVSTGFSNTPMYRSYILGPQAIAWTENMPDYPVETRREPLQGNLGGTTTLITRRNRLFHVRGYTFTSSSVSGKSPTWAELATAANWDRKRARKSVKIAFLETN